MEIMPFGRYNGKSVAAIALSDYSYLCWAQTIVHKQSVLHDIERSRFALNNYAPQGQCYTCKAPPKVVSIAAGNGEWLIESAYLFCDSKRCQDSTGLDGPRAIKPIKHDTLLAFSQSGDREPKYAIKRFQERLNELAGFTGRRTRDRCEQFLEDLITKLQAPVVKPTIIQPTLF
ncbi:hypothetical protein HY642_06010 [Candidatus Woesearchaeota archaeon]|nr:hypothetical protein [Candidatus Woesearchaeota archaeon]